MHYKIQIITCFLIFFVTPLFAEDLSRSQFEFDNIVKSNSRYIAEKLILDTINQSNDNNKILLFSLKYYNLVRKKELSQKVPLALKQIGNAYRQLSMNDSATHYLYLAFNQAKKLKDTLTMIESSIYLGLLSTRYSDFKMTEKHYRNAYNLSLSYGHPFEIASASWNMAYVKAATKNFKESFAFAKESLKNLNLIKDKNTYLVKFGYSLAYYYFGSYYHFTHQYDSSNYYYQKSIDFSNKINNHNLLAPAYYEISFNLNFEGIIEKIPLAIIFAQKCIESAEIINDFHFLQCGYEQKYLAYEKLGNTDSALSSLKKFKQYSDSLQKYDAQITAAKSELALSENEFRRKEELNKIRNKYTLGISIAVITSLLFIFLFLFNRYKLKSKLNRQLAEANRTKDKFFSIISHDLRTPVSSIATLSDLFEKHYSILSEDEKINYISNLRKSSENVMNLTENLLQWAAIQSNNIQPRKEVFDLAQIINIEIENFRNLLTAKNLEIEHISSVINVYADRNMIAGVIRNLLSNAIKYSYPESKIIIASKIESNSIKTTIEDFGTGISDADKSKIFHIDKKLSQVGTNNERGTGLGLSICKEFIEKNGGEISFESALGEGSTFKITLPNANIVQYDA